MSGSSANATSKPWRGGLGVATLLLASCLPAAAQNLLLPARVTLETVPAFSASLRFPPVSKRFQHSGHQHSGGVSGAEPRFGSAISDGIRGDTVPGPDATVVRVTRRRALGTEVLRSARAHGEYLLALPAFGGSRAVGVATQAQHPGIGFRYRERAMGSPSP
jgi:hypothetical protein